MPVWNELPSAVLSLPNQRGVVSVKSSDSVKREIAAYSRIQRREDRLSGTRRDDRLHNPQSL